MPLKRHEAIVPLSRQHQKGLLLAQLLKRDTPDYKGLPNTIEGKIRYTKKVWKKELQPHFKLEEEILFPVAQATSNELKEMIQYLIRDHKEIERRIASLSMNQADENMHELGLLLEKHIRKEEREIFHKIQEQLSEKQLEKISRLLEIHIQ